MPVLNALWKSHKSALTNQCIESSHSVLQLSKWCSKFRNSAWKLQKILKISLCVKKKCLFQVLPKNWSCWSVMNKEIKYWHFLKFVYIKSYTDSGSFQSIQLLPIYRVVCIFLNKDDEEYVISKHVFLSNVVSCF